MSLRKILFLVATAPSSRSPPTSRSIRWPSSGWYGVIPALLKLKAAGYEFVMVSNQDGLGTDSFPWADFEPPQQLLLQILEFAGHPLQRHPYRSALRTPERADAEARHRHAARLPQGRARWTSRKVR